MLFFPRLLAAILLFCVFACQANANSPLSINKRLGIPSETKSHSIDIHVQIEELQQDIARLKKEQQAYQAIYDSNEATQQRLYEQLEQSKQPLSISPNIDIAQQASMSYSLLTELKESEKQSSQLYSQLVRSREQLPELIATARTALSQHLRTPQAPVDTPLGLKYQLQVELLNQHIDSLQTQLKANPIQIKINQLNQQVLRYSLKQQENFIEQLNLKIGVKRQTQTDNTIASYLSQPLQQDPISQQLNKTNINFTQQLKLLNGKIDDTISKQESVEKRYQSQSIQLNNVKEQITWVKTNAAFGERFLDILQSLPKPPNLAQIQNDMADARLARYQFEQTTIELENKLQNHTNLPKQQLQLLQSQQNLLSQLTHSNDQYLNELAKLRLAYEQLTQLHNLLKNTLNEHLFWVPNAQSIGTIWAANLFKSIAWLAHPEQWHQLKQEWKVQNYLWAWWVILLILCLMAQDMLSPKFTRMNARYATYVGNVTQDKFIYTIKTLAATFAYAAIKPLPVIIGGAILFMSKHNFVFALGCGLLALGANFFIFRFIYLLYAENGVLTKHFRRPAPKIATLQGKVFIFALMTTPLMTIMGFTEMLDTSFVRNSLGRGAFIILCIVLFDFYRGVFLFAESTLENHPNKQNMRLLQKLLWLFIIAVPVISLIAAAIGYYFTAVQLLMQLQISIIVGLCFLLLYQLIKRWMLIEQRLIAFDRAKAKRAEQLSQRERGELNSSEPLESYEEPVIDLDTIASQSIGLVRTLLMLAFIASLIALLSHTHTAVLSFLDGITLWTTNSTINGLEQQVPITLKSLVVGVVLTWFSIIIAKNLPGMLELTILQRLDLSPGTGFAITTVSSYLIVLLGMIIGFSSLGLEWSKLQWLVAALSVGLGFGLQEIFANFISGLIILFEKPIRIGDTVTIRNLTGTVTRIEIRATTISDWDRKEIIVPNKAFITEQLVNWSLSDPITRVIVKVSVARDADPTKVEMLLHQAVRECEMSLSTPEPDVWFVGFGQHTQDYEVRSYAKEMDDRMPLRHMLHKQISKKLRQNQVELAYPQMEIHLNNGNSRDQSSLLKV
ncbi:mechanosensitive ion channel domain-containing protein [Shewanella intestini]|uniref:Mechanosensitive ion channel n=1 Tax=Shewanella intestini TaxID=2017544 RepID=A0ABS5I0X7_9GAMM|nr:MULTISPECIES: mechanosensitive ion channel domain-containing protein [Shewanella]MBR9727676.1 mechanosensitive ion channel [Shewanella intestini]MRG35174.1 mechanosensitive ion channel [Shewanella sp. XMDDZSB0408]